jgi:hypothetical protein
MNFFVTIAGILPIAVTDVQTKPATTVRSVLAYIAKQRI